MVLWPSDGPVQAVDLGTGAVLWQSPDRVIDFATTADTLFVRTGDGVIYALDATTGATRWRWGTGSADERSGLPLHATPAGPGEVELEAYVGSVLTGFTREGPPPLAAPVTVTGTVRIAGHPVRGVRVRVGEDTSPPTDARGRYRVTTTTPGLLAVRIDDDHLQAAAAGYCLYGWDEQVRVGDAPRAVADLSYRAERMTPWGSCYDEQAPSGAARYRAGEGTAADSATTTRIAASEDAMLPRIPGGRDAGASRSGRPSTGRCRAPSAAETRRRCVPRWSPPPRSRRGIRRAAGPESTGRARTSASSAATESVAWGRTPAGARRTVRRGVRSAGGRRPEMRLPIRAGRRRTRWRRRPR